MCRPQSSRHIPCAVHKVVGTFHVPSTRNLGKSLTAIGTAERARTFCRLCIEGGNSTGFKRFDRLIHVRTKMDLASLVPNGRNTLGVQSPKNSIPPSPRFDRFEEKGPGDEEPDDSHLAHTSPCQIYRKTRTQKSLASRSASALLGCPHIPATMDKGNIVGESWTNRG
jgi:hypothetical protein